MAEQAAHIRSTDVRFIPEGPILLTKEDTGKAFCVDRWSNLRDWQMWLCTRLLSETKQVRFLHPAPGVIGGFFQLGQDHVF